MIAERYISIDLRSKLGTILVLHAVLICQQNTATVLLWSCHHLQIVAWGSADQLSFGGKNLERTPHLDLPFGALLFAAETNWHFNFKRSRGDQDTKKNNSNTNVAYSVSTTGSYQNNRLFKWQQFNFLFIIP